MGQAAVRISTLALSALLAACSGGGESAAPAPAPRPQVAAPPSTVTIIDISQPWATATPAAAGMDEVRLGRAVRDAAAMPRFRSLLVARHGKIVSESYFGGANRSTSFDVRSVTKSVVSMLTGIALQSGQLSSLNATIGDHVAAPYAVDLMDRAVTVRELLTMTSRYQWNETSGNDYNNWVLSDDHAQFLLDRLQTDPAGEFNYNSAAVNLLGLVLERATAQSLPQFANDALFRHIGITTAQWELLEPGMVNGGSGIQMSAQDLLRFGQLLLQRGRTGNRQIVPESWIEAGTAAQFAWREIYGAQRGTTYGYLWWIAQPPATPAVFAWGFGGQFVYVVPSLDLVVATTTEWRGISAETSPTMFAASILTIIVNDILPAAL